MDTLLKPTNWVSTLAIHPIALPKLTLLFSFKTMLFLVSKPFNVNSILCICTIVHIL